MTDLTTLDLGDLLKTTWNNEPGWFLVKYIDNDAQTVSGRFLPAAGTGQRHCEAVTYAAAALTVTATIRCVHSESTVFAALVAGIGLHAAAGLLR
ncbi:MAG: hypothetical protein ACOYB3_01285 [Azonexus sp.]